MIPTQNYNQIAVNTVRNHLLCRKNDAEKAYNEAKQTGKTEICCNMYKDTADLYDKLAAELTPN